ncbi:MAG: carboxy-S-adenosyl-L-methionine synthase CmoA [Candidatus Omnitrophica bacterium]|nr:carboxy-S-adenosyl-L-methionine synthase CmoA [Candidatus Omnitrophota bacterium]
MKDTLYKNTSKISGKFNFDEDTARVFNDMLRRSVPHYHEIQAMICSIAKKFARRNSNIYDLGCSTGTTLLKISTALSRFPVIIIGIDNSEAMLKKANTRLQSSGSAAPCTLIKKDLNYASGFKNASVIISNLTLQFIRPINRERLLSEIYTGLNTNGAFILVEKITSKNQKIKRTFDGLYHDFKLKNGYSKSEISRKREALKNVLIPYAAEENVRLLKKSGFRLIDVFFRWYNFCGILAIK